MRRLANAFVWTTALFALAALPPPSIAQPSENPPSFAPERIAGIRTVGENYRIQGPARSDGLLRIYTLVTPYGEFSVHGDQMLRMRINELIALQELDKISGSEAFSKALVEAGLSPLKYTGRLITNPVKTVGDTFSGIGAMFGRIQSGVANVGKVQGGNPVAALLGVTEQKRKLAAKLGVDPYTDFEPLDAKLTRLSEAAATGGLTVSGALMVIPGAAGIVVSNLHTVNSIEGTKLEVLARDYTPEQILDLNRKRLGAMGADRDLIEALLSNRAYSPIDMAAMTAALDSMPGVSERTVFLARAAQIERRSIAYFMRRHAEFLADYHARTGSLRSFVSLGGYPFNVARDGRIVGLMPIDALSWTQGTAVVLGESAADARRLAPRARVELRITGTATAMAKAQLKTLGWTVVENTRF